MDDELLSKRLCKKMGIEDSKAVVNGSCSHIKEDEYLEKELEELKKSETLPSYKLAQENARYMISVFTPTTIEYTISFRQAFLTIDYLNKLIKNCEALNDNFSKKLLVSAKELADELSNAVGEQKLHDNKNQYIRFLEAQHIGDIVDGELKIYEDLDRRLDTKRTAIGDSYTVVYNGSLAMLAQAQRHRTIRYSMCLREAGEYGFYVPEIIKGTKIEAEWIEDIKSVAYCIPQGTLVRITEQGIFEDFAMKCKERLCGRAQLEVMKSTEETANKFIENKSNLSYENQRLLYTMIEGYIVSVDDSNPDKRIMKQAVCPRCKFTDFKCTEGCRWGAKEALSRLI
jgi:hypothetical protein